ncbi:recombinase family protein [Vibrio parahaemolyticus]
MDISKIKDLLVEKFPQGDTAELDKYLNVCLNPTNGVYHEEHHILPKHEFPEFKNLRKHKWNNSTLTYVEHIIAHFHYAKFCDTLEAWSSTQLLMQIKGIHLLDATVEQLVKLKEIAQHLREYKEWRAELSLNARGKIREEGKLCGKQPFWIDLVDGKPILNDKVYIAKKIIDLALAGYGDGMIANELNKLKIPSTQGKEWRGRSISIVVNSPALYGAKQYYFNKQPAELIEGLYPAICNYETWKTINGKRIRKGGNFTKRTPILQLIKCSCGEKVNARTQKRDTGNNYTYLSCPKCGSISNLSLVDVILEKMQCIDSLKEIFRLESNYLKCVRLQDEIGEVLIEATDNKVNVHFKHNESEFNFDVFKQIRATFSLDIESNPTVNPVKSNVVQLKVPTTKRKPIKPDVLDFLAA